ncbi:MAG: sugar ABC transporter ATP-binding protein [Bacillota bacterium]|nr:sugar ABC transporter ATP-binding protein [Bacillota bacterium]
MTKIVELKNVVKTFSGAVAIDGMNLTIYEREIRCLIGENGCGKSTMIKGISGYHKFDSGELIINGKHYQNITPREAMDEGIQVIYQDFALFPNMTIAENIMMIDSTTQNRRLVNWKKMKEEARRTLERIKFDIDVDKYVADLNVAEKQMVAISRAIAQEAKLLIMDEPTSALTNAEVEKLFDVVRELKKNGVSVLFVTHKLDEVIRVSDSITVMRNGKNVYESNENTLSKEDMIYYMTGKRLSEQRSEDVKREGVPVLEVRNYNLDGAFKNVNFSLYKGEILGISGLMGCGKDRLAKALFGIEPASSGEVLINGKPIGLIRRVQDALDHNIGYVPEDRLTEGLHMDHTIADNAIARIIKQLRGKYSLLSKEVVRDKQDETLSMVRITGLRRDNPVRTLSGGNQQKVVLVKWLAANPDILILNAPTVGVDVGAKSEIHDIVRDLAKRGVSTIVISDDIPEVVQVCQRVLIMENGEIASEHLVKDITIEQLEAMISGKNKMVDAQ